MTRDPHLERKTLTGALYALGCFCLWGLNPVYFKTVATVPVIEVLAHRVVWSVPFLAILVALSRRWPHVADVLRNRRARSILMLTALILATNWSLYIWAVASAQIVQSGLGYYINPLVNMLLGTLVLHERLKPWQWAAVALAAAGVLNLAIAYGEFPWLAVSLAVTFGVYGLLRKIVAAESLDGLMVETLLLLPVALALLVYLAVIDAGSFGTVSTHLDLMLILAGPVTAVPLLLFAAAARKLRLAALGFCQYLSPTLQLLLAVAVYGEPFTPAHLVTFGCVWIAIVIYSLDSLRGQRRRAIRHPRESGDPS
ncbi:MAG TPA: EamA family transporter RarD [Hypericibacter adhaerens]|uniref:Chloramphenicol resistance permease RarD n=1 Tax=Hypericibacter adhaerens TaxID=2602016 RepID=A0A5J6N5D0_9PROT|nr:EamA family transporter RarD [Hypericibacter adhaerens]QEX24085.1 chloramphenicol resistance permease RarD [Hypericibacter adhaerens]HWA45252.1 EamA family transporter RarD [Hypericibacter adhaerens]